MNGKKLMTGMAAAALGIMGGLAPTAVETASTIAQSNQVVVEQQAPQRNVNQGQSQNAVSQQKTAQGVQQQNFTKPSHPRYYVDCGMSPKEYGLYLLRSGKYHQNMLKRKHYAKA